MERLDSIGPLKLVQSRHGVKASVDGLLLARYVKPSPGWRVADLGCGNGLVGLLMALEQPLSHVVGVEIQNALVRQAARSAGLNHISGIHFLRADLRHPPWKDDLSSFQLVVANPPYRKVGTGRLSPDPVRAAARHEILGDVQDFTAAAASLLCPGCSAGWIYLAERREDLFNSALSAGLEPVRFRCVKSRKGEAPSLVLLETIKGKSGHEPVEEKPLILYRTGKGRDYTDEARSILYGEKWAGARRQDEEIVQR